MYRVLLYLLLPAITSLANAQNVGTFYGSTDGSEAIGLNLGRTSSGASQFRYYTTDGGTGIFRLHSYRYGGDFYWSRGSASGTRNIARLTAGSGSSYFELYDFNGVPKIRLHAGSNSFFEVGNFGIGTNSPNSKLDVRGAITVGEGTQPGHPQILGLFTSSDQSPNLVLLKTTASTSYKGGRIEWNPADGFRFQGAGATGSYDPDVGTLMTLDFKNEGRVGIGIQDPSDKLEVNGTIRSKEIKVEAVGWPDYVFSKDYQLTSLRETESFINENQHLPGIPSAKEVQAEGISLGEMNAKLLEKIEELTLYVIGQEKQIELLRVGYEKLELELEELRSQ